MTISRPFKRLGELLLVQADLRGPRATMSARLVFDTGAAATTLVPEFIEDLGYSARDGRQLKRMHSALSEEEGYTLEVAELSVLGVTTPNFEVHVFDHRRPGHPGKVSYRALRSGSARRSRLTRR